MVRRWERVLGVPEGSWPAIPSLRAVVVSVAVEGLVEEDATNQGDARAAAAAALGLEDDPYRRTRPSDRLGRRLRDWRARAGEYLHADDREAA